MRPRLKICGITRAEDALLAASLGVHALGFIFYKKSPRYISPERASDFCGLNLIQLHGNESPLFCEKLSLACIKAFRIKDETSLKNMAAYKEKVRGFLVDTYKKDQPGGTGESFNWELAIKAKVYNVPIILAGGLNPDNIKRAIEITQPYALDVNSGIEKAPGIKDKDLMKKLFVVWNKL